MSSDIDQPRQRTVAELLAENAQVAANAGRRRRRREADERQPDDAAGLAAVREGFTPREPGAGSRDSSLPRATEPAASYREQRNGAATGERRSGPGRHGEPRNGATVGRPRNGSGRDGSPRDAPTAGEPRSDVREPQGGARSYGERSGAGGYPGRRRSAVPRRAPSAPGTPRTGSPPQVSGPYGGPGLRGAPPRGAEAGRPDQRAPQGGTPDRPEPRSASSPQAREHSIDPWQPSGPASEARRLGDWPSDAPENMRPQASSPGPRPSVGRPPDARAQQPAAGDPLQETLPHQAHRAGPRAPEPVDRALQAPKAASAVQRPPQPEAGRSMQAWLPAAPAGGGPSRRDDWETDVLARTTAAPESPTSRFVADRRAGDEPAGPDSGDGGPPTQFGDMSALLDDSSTSAEEELGSPPSSAAEVDLYDEPDLRDAGEDADDETREEAGPPRMVGRPGAPAGTGQAWAAVLGQWIAGALVGAAVWVGFRYLWSSLPVVALAAAVSVTVGLVLAVRALLRNDDLRTTLFAVGVGLLLTVSPALLVLLDR